MKSFKPLVLCAALIAGAAAWAGDENLPDPTRAPAVLSAPVQGKGGAADEAADSQAAVQAIKYSQSYKAAVIDGQEIPLGGEYRGARVVAITPTEVVLRSGKEKQVLKLFPQVEKKVASPASTSPAKNQIQRKKSS